MITFYQSLEDSERQQIDSWILKTEKSLTTVGILYCEWRINRIIKKIEKRRKKQNQY